MITNAALAIFFAFLNVNTSLIVIKINPNTNPIIEITKNITCGTKLESVNPVVFGLSIYLGIKINTNIKTIGIMTPIILYNYGLDELRQIKHQNTLNTIAIIIMNVPVPIPNIMPLVD